MGEPEPMPLRSPTFIRTMTRKHPYPRRLVWRVCALGIWEFLFTMSKVQVVRSIVQIPVAPFDFKTIAGGNLMAQRVAASLSYPRVDTSWCHRCRTDYCPLCLYARLPEPALR